MKNIAYVVVNETRNEKAGIYLGIAHKGEKGYQPLRPGFGPYKSWDAAQEHADEINKALGVKPKAALLILASTLGRGK